MTVAVSVPCAWYLMAPQLLGLLHEKKGSGIANPVMTHKVY